MLIDTLKTLFARDLSKLKTEIVAYQKEENIWLTDKAIANSAGNLCMHLVGNLNTYIGVQFGGTNYVRDRESEFAAKDIPRAALVRMIEDTISVVGSSLDEIKQGDLMAEYPQLVFKEKTSTEFMLVHLATHLAYHLGQVNYHRRLLDAN